MSRAAAPFCKDVKLAQAGFPRLHVQQLHDPHVVATETLYTSLNEAERYCCNLAKMRSEHNLGQRSNEGRTWSNETQQDALQASLRLAATTCGRGMAACISTADAPHDNENCGLWCTSSKSLSHGRNSQLIVLYALVEPVKPRSLVNNCTVKHILVACKVIGNGKA